MAVDDFANTDSVTSQGRVIRTPPANSDTVDLLKYPKALWIIAAGNLAVTAVDGNLDNAGAADATSRLFAVAAGTVFDVVRVKRIWSTGTTATFWLIY
ncbi:MAG: hypothetical protein ACJ8FS_16570 [Sphingomicrobium sp.]